MTENPEQTSPALEAAKAATEALAQAVRDIRHQHTITELVRAAAAANPQAIDRLQALADRAIAEKWDAQRTELELLRAARPAVSAVANPAPVATQQAVLEAALCLAAGVSDEKLAKDREYGERVVEQAWKLRRNGLRGTLALALEANGYRVPHSGEDFYRTLVASARVQASGFSTINLPGLLGNVANKILLEGFQAVPSTYQLIAQVMDVSNFHRRNIYRLDHTGHFHLVAPTGDLQHVALVEDAYSNKLETYGMMLTISRTHIIDDELGLVRQAIFNMGNSARNAVEKQLYLQVMEAADNFYTAAKGNRLTSSPLSLNTLGQARAALAKMTNAAGDPLGTEGRYLLVPSELEPTANQIFTSTTVTITGPNDRERPVDNYFRNRFIPVASPYLSSGSGNGQSPTTWYLLADPQVLPAFQVMFLNGQRAPIIESSDTEFNTLGLQLRAYWDFGVARIDHRGAIKATA